MEETSVLVACAIHNDRVGFRTAFGTRHHILGIGVRKAIRSLVFDEVAVAGEVRGAGATARGAVVCEGGSVTGCARLVLGAVGSLTATTVPLTGMEWLYLMIEIRRRNNVVENGR